MMTLLFALPRRGSGRRTIVGILLAGGLMLGIGSARAESVTIDNFTFSPAVLTVQSGATVTWTNADDIPHTVTATDKVFKSKPLDTNDHFTFTFAKPGEYAYFCSLHPHMMGRIVVKAP